MRIGLLTTSYPRRPGDYAGSFVGDRVGQLLAEGHVVEVLAAADGAEGPEATDHPGLRVTRLPAAIGGGPSLFYGAGAPETLERGGASAYLSAVRFSATLVGAARARAARWDSIEAHWLVPSALAALAAAPTLIRSAYAHSGDVALLERIALGGTLARRLARGVPELRFVSERLRQRFAALAGTAVGTVESLVAPPAVFGRRPNGPDSAARRSLGLRATTVLAVGRLVPIKGHDLLLQACARLNGPRRDSVGEVVGEVVILGDGPERDRLVRLARAAGVPLRLPGFVSRDEVARWLSAADVYVQPSVKLANGRAEGAPLATAEARAVGIPVVVESDPGRLADAIRSVTAV